MDAEMQDTRALVHIKRVVDDCSFDVVESMRQIRQIIAEPDPIAEIEAMGGRLILGTDDEINYQMYWFVKPGWTEVATTDEYTTSASPADLRAAAARLLARVRGAK